MKMWMVDPKLMCRKHLLGEHVELHMFVGAINKAKNLDGYIDKGLLEVHNIIKRHKRIVKEMLKRGYNHKSNISEDYYWIPLYWGKIDRKANLKELAKRCPECREKINAIS